MANCSLLKRRVLGAEYLNNNLASVLQAQEELSQAARIIIREALEALRRVLGAVESIRTRWRRPTP